MYKVVRKSRDGEFDGRVSMTLSEFKKALQGQYNCFIYVQMTEHIARFLPVARTTIKRQLDDLRGVNGEYVALIDTDRDLIIGDFPGRKEMVEKWLKTKNTYL